MPGEGAPLLHERWARSPTEPRPGCGWSLPAPFLQNSNGHPWFERAELTGHSCAVNKSHTQHLPDAPPRESRQEKGKGQENGVSGRRRIAQLRRRKGRRWDRTRKGVESQRKQNDRGETMGVPDTPCPGPWQPFRCKFLQSLEELKRNNLLRNW